MLAHCARLERENAQLKKAEAEWRRREQEGLTPKAPSVSPKKGKSVLPAASRSDRPTPTVPPNLPSAEALTTLREGIQSLREVLIASATQIDEFAKKEFDLFDPKVKPLLVLRTTLLKAAGQSGKVPPPVPRMSQAVIDISDLAEVINSLRPAASVDVEVLNIPKAPRVGLPNE